jgi:hypothetical protein
LTVALNTVRGGIVLTNPDVAPTVDLSKATSISIASSDIATASVSAEYAEWAKVGKPVCWTYPRQCHGDADGLQESTGKGGYSHVGQNDMNILLAAWMKSSSAVVGTNLICADFAHDEGGDATSGFYRVGPTDLNILLYYWLQPDTEVPADCGANLKL